LGSVNFLDLNLENIEVSHFGSKSSK
jgi:hypothetical protein